MRITTKAVFDIASGDLLEWEGYDYDGPVALCGRSESKATNKQALATSTQDQNNAQTALASTNSGLADYAARLKQFALANPYKLGGEYARQYGILNADAADAGDNTMRASIQNDITRTGANTGAAQNIIAEAQRQKTRDLADRGAQTEADRIGKNAAYNAQVLQSAQYAPDVTSRLFGTATGGATSALNPAAETAVGSKGFGQTFGDAFATTLGKTLGGPKIPAGGGD